MRLETLHKGVVQYTPTPDIPPTDTNAAPKQLKKPKYRKFFKSEMSDQPRVSTFNPTAVKGTDL